MTFANLNHCWGSLIIEELVRSGASYFALASGSRSSPLAVPLARNSKATSVVHFDERGLAFHAMGYTAATRRPSVLICTSGTAGAHFLPAVIEASKKKLPLIVLTADRPPELRQTGAVQTIDQVGLFGKFVVWHTDLPCPDLQIPPAFVLTTIDQAVHLARAKKGVVHINCMFREPLAPTVVSTPWQTYLQEVQSWLLSDQPWTTYETGEAGRPIHAADIAQRIKKIRRGLIVVGKLAGPKEAAAVLKLSRQLQWPIFPDVSCGLRLGHKDPLIISYYDQLLLSASRRDKMDIDGVLHLGGRITSKRYYEFIEQKKPKAYIAVLNHPLRNDPLHQVTCRVESSVETFCRSLTPLLPAGTPAPWLKALQNSNQAINQYLDDFCRQDIRLNEPMVARLISQQLPPNTGLYLANSMPVRDMDMFADDKGKVVEVQGNRGASGIDGLIASASGYAQGLKAPVTVMAGDLSALHDLNSLSLLKSVEYPLILVVLNNGGGGIFSFLPIAEHKDVFEKFYATPHPFMFANAAAMFELNYKQPVDAPGLIKAYKKALRSQTSTIIEVITRREDNLKIHRQLNTHLERL